MSKSNRRRFLAQASAVAAAAAVPSGARAQGRPVDRPANAATNVKKVHWEGGKRPEKTPLFSGAVSYGNMLFLAIFGKNVEDALGSVRYLLFYFAGGFAAMATQTAMTLLFGSALDATVPNLGASGAIAAVLGCYFVLYPRSRILTFIGWIPVRIHASFFLGGWFLYQLIEANFGMFGARAHGGGVAFFAHVGGFVFGFVVARVLLGAGRIAPQDDTAFRAPA